MSYLTLFSHEIRVFCLVSILTTEVLWFLYTIYTTFLHLIRFINVTLETLRNYHWGLWLHNFYVCDLSFVSLRTKWNPQFNTYYALTVNNQFCSKLSLTNWRIYQWGWKVKSLIFFWVIPMNFLSPITFLPLESSFNFFLRFYINYFI